MIRHRPQAARTGVAQPSQATRLRAAAVALLLRVLLAGIRSPCMAHGELSHGSFSPIKFHTHRPKCHQMLRCYCDLLLLVLQRSINQPEGSSLMASYDPCLWTVWYELYA